MIVNITTGTSTTEEATKSQQKQRVDDAMVVVVGAVILFIAVVLCLCRALPNCDYLLQTGAGSGVEGAPTRCYSHSFAN